MPRVAAATAPMTRLERAEYRALDRYMSGPLRQFSPRPDRPEDFDQQTSFVGRNAKVAIAAGGNRSGKSFSAAMKCADLVLWQQEPPWKNTPFVIVSDTLETTCDICWSQNLEALIPPDQIEHIAYHNRGKNHPSRITLLQKWKTPGVNWVIEFHALGQGRRNLQGRKIGGCWFSEQFEWPIFDEVLRGCAHTWYDGAQFAEFTPVDPRLCSAVEQRRKLAMKGLLPGWKFYRLNTNMNRHNVDAGWFKSWFSQLDPSIRETRLTGALPIFKGLVYPHFNPDIHILDDAGWERVTGKPFPGTEDRSKWEPNTEGAGRYTLSDHFGMKAAFPFHIQHFRGVDWGFTHDNAFVCLWAFKDGSGRWFIYDEFYEDFCGRTADRIEEIKTRWPWNNDFADIYGQAFCDSSRPDLINEFNLSGIPAHGATHQIEHGVECVRNQMAVSRVGDHSGREKLETRFYIYGPNCPHLLDEITQYQYVEGNSTGKNPRPGKPIPNDWNNHCLDAMRYVIYGNRVPGGDIGPSSIFVAGDPGRHGVRGGGRR